MKIFGKPINNREGSKIKKIMVTKKIKNKFFIIFIIKTLIKKVQKDNLKVRIIKDIKGL